MLMHSIPIAADISTTGECNSGYSYAQGRAKQQLARSLVLMARALRKPSNGEDMYWTTAAE
jgi:hypothetical protein